MPPIIVLMSGVRVSVLKPVRKFKTIVIIIIKSLERNTLVLNHTVRGDQRRHLASGVGSVDLSASGGPVTLDHLNLTNKM